MRKLLTLLTVSVASAMGQQPVTQTWWPNTGYDSGSATPAHCQPPSMFWNSSTSTFYVCAGSTFVAISYSGSTLATGSASAQSANVGAANLYAVPGGSANYLRACADVSLNATGGASGYFLGVAQLLYTQNGNSMLMTLGGGGSEGACVEIMADGGTEVQWQTNQYSAGSGGTPTYNVKVRLESLGS